MEIEVMGRVIRMIERTSGMQCSRLKYSTSTLKIVLSCTVLGFSVLTHRKNFSFVYVSTGWSAFDFSTKRFIRRASRVVTHHVGSSIRRLRGNVFNRSTNMNASVSSESDSRRAFLDSPDFSGIANRVADSARTLSKTITKKIRVGSVSNNPKLGLTQSIGVLFFLLLLIAARGDTANGIDSVKGVENGSVTPVLDLFTGKDDSIAHENGTYVCPTEFDVNKKDVKEEGKGEVKSRIGRAVENYKKFPDGVSDAFGFDLGKDAVVDCPTCGSGFDRDQMLEAIKSSILSKLGMPNPPNVTDKSKANFSEHKLLSLLRKRHGHHGSNGLYWVVQDDEFEGMQGDEPYNFGHSDPKRKHSETPRPKHYEIKNSDNFPEGEVYAEEDDDYHVRTERVLAFAQSHPRIRHMPDIQYFEFSEKLRMNKVKKAVLWIYIKGRQSRNVVGNRLTITIQKIADNGRGGGHHEIPVINGVRTDSTFSVPNGSGAWITMEFIQIKNLVTEWFRYPHTNLGITIKAEDEDHNNLVVTTSNGNDTTLLPFFEIYVTESRKHRTKRTIGLNCRDPSAETRCCRYPLTVDFEEFGWDWIIAPKKYEAYHCNGECPPVFLPQHPHTHITQLAIHDRKGPCCAPRKLSELEMLYFDNNLNIVFGKIPAMIVDRCGCI